MATQTGSIDLTASNSVKLMAEAGFESVEENYYTKAELDVTVQGINTEVSKKVNGTEIISTINQSAESVSINASKINLTGAVTISDLASDAQSATLNSNISVGGRNLLLAKPSSYKQTSYDAYIIPSSTSATELGAGTTLTIQFWDVELDSNSSGIGGYWGGGSSSNLFKVKPDENGYCSKTFAIPASTASHAQGANKFLNLYNFVNGHSGMSLSIGRWKLEKGNTATDWTPAPEDMAVVVGGRNYAKTRDSIGTTVTNNGVTFTVAGPSTVTVNGTATAIAMPSNAWFGGLTLDPGTYSLWLTNTNGGTLYFRLGKGASKTHVWSTSGDYNRETPYVFTVSESDTYWFGPVCVAGTYSNVETRYMLEKGNKATDWSPAPEDVDSAISDAAKTATSYVTEITGQNGIMVHPSTDQTTGVRITSDVDILRAGTSVANYGTTARIGTAAGKHVSIDSDSVDLMDGNASLATFGANDTHIGLAGAGRVYMADDKFLLSAETSEVEYETGKTYTQVESGFKAQNLGENYRVYSGLNSRLDYNDDGGHTSSDTYIDAWVEDDTGSELRRAYIELWADPLYQTAVRLYGDEIGLDGANIWYLSPYDTSNSIQLGKPVVRSSSKSMTITSTNTWIDGPSVHLDQGQWLVVGVACFNTGSSSGDRKLRAQLRLDSSVYVEGTEVRVASNEYGRIQATAVMTVSGANGLDATLVLSSSMSFTTATTSYVTAAQLA